ncbi:AAC(3) family N-acetyltransferase [Cystobacter fuscus]|uniref:Aminoglycoside N(3)-acetyltransferase n=1 Tax=Cystobacter fuscus TaxID=43 RepID=A0A250J1M1_9BACT|nr:AAC(3) family N-acetyltransferase [Cystobacter fuscus]ATB37884.1 AAC(3) family N-acetyltransferase [Cystobacter fuscus]
MRTREQLVNDLRQLGVNAGDLVMVHASLRAIGPVEGGVGGVLDSLDAAVGPDGTLIPWNDYYGPGSPLEHAWRSGVRVLRLGADLNTVTLLHLAEYLVELPSKRRVRRYVRVLGPHGPEERTVDCLDDEFGIVDTQGEDYFGLLLRDYLARGTARTGRVGHAVSELLDGADVLSFGVQWMAEHLG